jgi:predicted enzyme related to lactoylglutathione lyase
VTVSEAEQIWNHTMASKFVVHERYVRDWRKKIYFYKAVVTGKLSVGKK